MSQATLSHSQADLPPVADEAVGPSPRSSASFDPDCSPATRELWRDGTAGGLIESETEREGSTVGEAVWSCVSQLADDLGADSILELLEDFTEQTPLRLLELHRLAGQAERQTVLHRAAHSLKGSSSIFGLARLERAALSLEHSAAEGELFGQSCLVVALEREFSRVRPVLESIKTKLLPKPH